MEHPTTSNHHKPSLQRLLTALGLDIDYTRGRGASLFCSQKSIGGDRNADDECAVLDLVGGFGALLLGHSPPTLVALGRKLLEDERPFCSQGSRAALAEQLAEQLSQRAGGDFCCVFSNSGAEAVEAALKHALLETGGRTLIAVEGAFHGKTLGALQAVGNPQLLAPFELQGLQVLRVPLNDCQTLDATFRDAKDLVGFLFEPILGEGGVRPLSAEFLQRAERHCSAASIPLIADECQTGCGRTGRWLACEKLGVHPDYIILSKVLGGGLGKLGAALIRRNRYREDFDWMQSSTFAADDPTSALALETLRLIDTDCLDKIEQLGERFRDSLEEVVRAFPDVLREVRGRGLMLGLEFHPPRNSASFVFRTMAARNQLLYLVAAYLLHRHRVRVFPTLSDPRTLRLQPAACITHSQWAEWIEALRDVCEKIRAADWPSLSGFLLERPTLPATRPTRWLGTGSLCAFDAPRFARQQIRRPDRRVGWLCHLVDVDDLTRQEPRLGDLPFARREQLLERFAPLAGPVVMSGVDVHSLAGDAVRLYPILLPFSSRMARRWSESRSLAVPQMMIRDGVRLAGELGCSVLALGQYTSILTRDGRLVEQDPEIATHATTQSMRICSGNNYTVALAMEAMERLLRERSLDPANCTLAITGALGNIGSTSAQLLAPRFQRTLLLGSGRQSGQNRLRRLAASLPRTAVIDEPHGLRAAHLVVSAVSAVSPPFGGEHFGPQAIICDVSVPSSLRSDAKTMRPDLAIFRGGIARLPNGEDLEIASYPLPPGQVFGCLAEALLLGFDPAAIGHFTGPVTPARVRQTAEIAQRFGLELAELRSECVLGTGVLEEAYGCS